MINSANLKRYISFAGSRSLLYTYQHITFHYQAVKVLF